MKNLLIGVLMLFVNNTTNGQSNNCNLENCINSTFNSSHINKWKVVNRGDNLVESDTFILTEAKSGDTAYTDLDGLVSVIFTKSFSVIAEHEDKSIYILPYKSAGVPVKLKNQLPDSINKFFDTDAEYEMDSLSNSIFRTYEGDNIFTIKIDRNKCLVDWIEIVQNETEETEDENGFVIETLVKKTIRYVLISNISDRNKINKLISPERYVLVKNKINTIQPAYKAYELKDLTTEIE